MLKSISICFAQTVSSQSVQTANTELLGHFFYKKVNLKHKILLVFPKKFLPLHT